MSELFRWNNGNKKRKKNSKNKQKKTQISECSVPSYRIDLQTPPSLRWSAIIKPYRKQIKRLIDAILSLEQFQVSSDDESNFQKTNDPNSNLSFFSNLTVGVFESLKNLGGHQYVKEMEGIANILKSDGILIEHVLLTHLLYESFCGCTSIISKSMTLGRTLDWIDFDEQLLRNLTIDIAVYDGKKYLYRFTTFCGYIGALTALKFNQFGFAINFREHSSNQSGEDDADKWPIGLLGRYVCECCNDYEAAAKMWNFELLMAPTYVLLSGKKESMLITRDEAQSVKPLKLRMKEDDEEENKEECAEYILQTNIDHWTYGQKKKKKKKIDDDVMDSVRRLNVGHKYLKQCSGDLNEETMWNILYQFPIHDKNWTIYSTVMSVKSGYYKTVRHVY